MVLVTTLAWDVPTAAANYDPEATIDSGDCIFCQPGTFIPVGRHDRRQRRRMGRCWYVIFNEELGTLSGSLGFSVHWRRIVQWF